MEFETEFPDELIKSLIKFICHTSRILFVDRMSVWKKFHSSSADYLVKWGDYSAEELCNEFLYKILPRIKDFELSEDQEATIDTLQVHPALRRTPNGFQRKDVMQRGKQPVLREGRDFQFVNANNIDAILSKPSEPAPTTFVPNKRKHNPPPSHTIMCRREDSHLVTRRITLLDENSVLMSVALSSQLEVAFQKLLETDEILSRLRQAKGKFEDRADMPVHCKDFSFLINSVKALTDVHKAIVNAINKRMRYE